MSANPNDVNEIIEAIQAGEPGKFFYRGRWYSYATPKRKAKKEK